MTPEPMPVAGRFMPKKLPAEMPSAVIVTTDCRADSTMAGRSASVMILAATASGVAAAPAVAGAAAGRVAEMIPTVPTDARTAARTLAPTTDRMPREETRRSALDGAGVAGADA